jgi:DNA repair protein RadC
MAMTMHLLGLMHSEQAKGVPMKNVYASVHLDIERELPAAWDLMDLLKQGGLADMTQEVMWVVPYDSAMQIRTIVEVARGGYHSMDVPIPAILSAVLLAATDRFIIAHNHSTSDVTPTTADVDLTRKVMEAANACGLFFEDHLIVGPNGEEFSMTDHNIIIPAKELKAMARSNRKAIV